MRNQSVRLIKHLKTARHCDNVLCRTQPLNGIYISKAAKLWMQIFSF